MEKIRKIVIKSLIAIYIIETVMVTTSFGVEKSASKNEVKNENISTNEVKENTTSFNVSNDVSKNENSAKNDEQIEANEIKVKNNEKEEEKESKVLTTNDNTTINNNLGAKKNIELVEEKNETDEESEFNNYEANKLQVVYMTHIYKSKWQKPVIDSTTSGITGKGKVLDELKIKLINAPENAKIKYKYLNEQLKWSDEIYDGAIAGESQKKLFGIRISLENMEAYSIQYRVYAGTNGWLDWATDGAISGAIADKTPIEAIQIRIISKINKQTEIKYKSYVENEGWENFVKSGEISGTTGQGKAMYSFILEIDNPKFETNILYQTYLQSSGWQKWKSNGAIAGDEEQKDRIEAIKIKLQNLEGYKIQYRAHVQDIGWQSWVNNGAIAGTVGQGKRLEAIQIKFVKIKTETTTTGEMTIAYNSHIQNYGWEKDFSKKNGETSGTVSQGKRVEAIKLKLLNAPEKSKVKYSVYVEGQGWQSDKTNGQIAGTTGKGLKIFGIKICLEGIENYTVMYRVHVQDIGWMPWVRDGQETGSITSKKRIEAIEVKFVAKSKVLSVSYNTHIQNIGWESDFSKMDGGTAGTTGKNLGIEAFKIKLNGNASGTGIQYRSYVEGKGWQAWKNNGNVSGTTGKSLKVLGFKIRLTGMPQYSVQYRAHIQDYGWSEWGVDEQTIGKISEGKRIEAIQIRLIGKTVSYPQNVCYSSKIQVLGWEEDGLHKNGEMSGTTGKSLGIYGIKLKLENYKEKQAIEYRVHVQDLGWLKWTTNEYNSQADGRRLEAIQIRLKNMDEYTVEYRAHVQDLGWQDWMIDGETAGTTGRGKRIEAFQIRIVPKYKRRYVGIDVSEWNHSINWQAVKNSGVDFAIIRSGYGQLSSQKDSCFETNYRNARMANIKVGSYLYSYAKSIEDARREANNCLNWLSNRSFEYPIFYDLEDNSQSGLSVQTITDMAKVFCSIVNKAGYKVGVYANRNWLMNKIDTSQLPSYCQVWLAHYTNQTDYPGEYQLWQYTSTGRVNGIDGYVDMNVGYKNYQ